jgi:hypothetical protein
VAEVLLRFGNKYHFVYRQTGAEVKLSCKIFPADGGIAATVEDLSAFAFLDLMGTS